MTNKTKKSKKLKFCTQFNKCCMRSYYHKRRRTRIKNHRRARKMMFHKAVRTWGYMPIPNEWM